MATLRTAGFAGCLDAWRGLRPLPGKHASGWLRRNLATLRRTQPWRLHDAGPALPEVTLAAGLTIYGQILFGAGGALRPRRGSGPGRG